MNLPNKITVARIALIPLMVIFFYIPLKNGVNLLISSLIYALAACTDFIDGYLARSRNEVTDIGKFLDPIADKLLVVIALFLIVESSVIRPNGLCAVLSGLIISRELLIGALRQIAATKNIVISADKLGKIKTVFTNFSLPMLLAAPIDKFNILYYTGYVLFIIAALMTVISGINYFIKNRKVFSEDGN